MNVLRCGTNGKQESDSLVELYYSVLVIGRDSLIDTMSHKMFDRLYHLALEELGTFYLAHY